MGAVNINEFMDRFHALELELKLFDSTIENEFWWDTVRFDVCYFVFGCLAGITYATTHLSPVRPRALGTLRRWGYRQLLFAKALVERKDLLVIRTARSVVEGRRRDVVLDPIIDLFRASSLAIDTVPRRYHLPDCDYSRRPGRVPQSLPDIITKFIAEFGLEPGQAAPLHQLIRRVRTEHECHVAGYHRLFDRARPRAVLLVGVDKALFHVASTRGVPTIEAQHGLIGHGHPAYSYPRRIEYGRQTAVPDLFLTFSQFWNTNGHYPVRRKEVVGTDYFAGGFAPASNPLGAIMIISANIYHCELLDLTRQLASLLPGRKFIYKLHPNQADEEAGIRAVLADLRNVEVGGARTSVSQLIGDVSHLVAVQSTVVYEALQHGRRICILPRHNYHVHADILTLPGVSVTDTAEDIAAALELPDPGGRGGPVFFEKFDPGRAFALLAELVENGRKAAE